MDKPNQQPELLTAEQVALRLLEEASLLNYRTAGRDGLVALRTGTGLWYRPADVDAFVRAHLQAA